MKRVWPRLRWGIWISMAGALGLLGVLALSFQNDPYRVPFALQGKAAPDFELSSLEGTSVALASFQGKPVVVNFWATWCYPCEAEHALLQKAAAFYGPLVQFVGIVYQDQPAAVQAYLARYPSLYPQLWDPQSKTAIDFGVAGVPETFIVNAQGRMLYKHAGVLTDHLLHQVLDPWVKPWVKKRRG